MFQWVNELPRGKRLHRHAENELSVPQYGWPDCQDFSTGEMRFQEGSICTGHAEDKHRVGHSIGGQNVEISIEKMKLREGSVCKGTQKMSLESASVWVARM